MFGGSIGGLLDLAGRSPFVQAALVILGTFILEDAATVLAAMRVQDSSLSWGVALGALYVGIVVGDMGLYGLGRLGAAFPRLRRLVPERRQAHGREWLNRHTFRVVFISRFIPGARLPTYTACGFLGASFRQFALAAVMATLVWTSMLFALSLRVGQVLVDYLGAWRWIGAIGFAAVIVAMGRIVARMQEDTP